MVRRFLMESSSSRLYMMVYGEIILLNMIPISLATLRENRPLGNASYII